MAPSGGESKAVEAEAQAQAHAQAAENGGSSPSMHLNGETRSPQNSPQKDFGSVDGQEKLKALLEDESICEKTSEIILQGFKRRKNGLDPYLRALLRIAIDSDLNILWRKKLEGILLEDEDLARAELKQEIRSPKGRDLEKIRDNGATEQEIELAAGHIGLRDEERFERELDYEQTFTWLMKQSDLLRENARHSLVQDALKKLNILTSYLNLFTKNTDTFEETLENVAVNTIEAFQHATESKTKLNESVDSVQVDLSRIIIRTRLEQRKGSAASVASAASATNINPSFLQLASFSRNRSSFFGADQMGGGSVVDNSGSMLGTYPSLGRKNSLGLTNLSRQGSFARNGSFHGSAHGGSFHGSSFHGSFHSRANSGHWQTIGNQLQDEEEKTAELGWKLLENGLRLYKFKRRRPGKNPSAKIFTIVEDQKLTWTGSKAAVGVISADQILPSWISEEKAEVHKWVVKHFHGLQHFLENAIRIKVFDDRENTWEMLLVARSQEIAKSVLAVFKEEAERRSIIESVYEGGRRSSLTELDGKMGRVHRRDSIDRLQTGERSKRSRNKVLIHQQGHSILKKANMPVIREQNKSAIQYRTKKREKQTRTPEEQAFLSKVLKMIPVFSDLSKKGLEEVTSLMRKIAITDGMELVHQGNFASNFYIIEQGKIACIELDKKQKNVKKKTVLGPEDHFGETSLILKSPLPFSVVSVEECTLWALDQETFSKIFSKNEAMQKVIETLSEVVIFNSLDDNLFSDMILKCKLVKFDPGEVIAKEEDFPAFFYVLQDGQVTVNNSWYTTSENDEEKFHKRLAIPGDCFGDFEICFGQTLASTYVADKDGASMLLLSSEYLQKFKTSVQDAVISNLKMQVLHSLPTFASLDEREIVDVISAFELKTYTRGQVIITKGATEDEFYFLKKGKCLVLDDIKKPQNVMTRIKGHGSFGELALLSYEPRSAWVVAETDVEVYSLRALQFNRLVKLVKEQSTKEHMIHVLQLIELLQVLSANDYKVLSDALVQEPYQGGDKVIKEGDINDKLFIVSRGEFLLTRTVSESASIERVRLLPGNYFGERALMASEKCKYDVTASRLSEVSTISRHVFEQYCGSLSNLLQVAMKKSEEETKLLNLKREDFIEKGIIGRGAFGSVRLVMDKGSQKWYAMKCLVKKDVVSKNHQKHLKQEIQIMSLLEHEMIIRLKKKWQDDRFIYLLTDVCSGGELFDEMQKHGKFSEERSKFYAACIVSMLCHLRETKVVFRDLKPENILIDSDGYLKLIDFGFAKKLEIGEKANSFCGTPDYIAPEVLLNEGYNYSVDIWGLGILVFEMLSSKTPFRQSPNSSNKHVMKAILNKKLTFPKESFVNVSKECIDFMKGCMKKEQIFRLGSKDPNELKEHPWFRDYGQHGWNALERKLIKPPFVPQDTDPEKIKIKAPKAKELTTPPVVQDYELDTIFADDELYKNGVFNDMPGNYDYSRRRSSIHSIGSLGGTEGSKGAGSRRASLS